MKKLILLSSFFFSFLISFSNPIPTSFAIISELYFDENGDWVIEMYFEYYDAEMDTGYVMITSTDTAFFKKFPDSTNFVLLTNADLDNPISIDKTGDIVRFEDWIYGMGMELSPAFIFGDFDGSSVMAPYSGQSLVSVSTFYQVKDTASSIGFHRDPAKGVLQGHIYDSVGTPLSYIQIQTHGIEARPIWSDENGYFSDTLYAKDHPIFVYNNYPNKIYDSIFSIEPDSITIHDIYLPVSAEIEFSGYCYLNNKDYHSGINIILTADFPSVPNDTLVTDSTGFFTGSVQVGNYLYRYSHDGYLPFSTYLSEDVFIDAIKYEQTLSEGIVHEIQQDYSSGNWTSDHPYWIFGNITVKENDTLSLEPGVQIEFKRKNHLNVYGTLLAEGNKEDTVYITNGMPNSLRWLSLSFYGESSSNSKLDFTVVNNCLNSLRFYNASPIISRSLINHSGGIKVFGSSKPYFSNSVFQSIVCNDWSSPILEKNIISYQIWCKDQSSPKIFHNDFYDFSRAIICFNSSQPEISGNIFQKGNCAIDMSYDLAPTIIEHNIFFDLQSPIWTDGNWLPGFGELDTTNVNGNKCDIYFNLFMDPLMKDPENGDFSLLGDSPCIDAGNADFTLDPDTTLADIGALYFDQTGVAIQTRESQISDIKLFHYPNPAYNIVNFVIEGDALHDLNKAGIKIYDISGNLVGGLPCPFLEKGFGKKVYQYQFGEKSTLKSGTYIYILEADGQLLSINKMVLVK